MRRIAPRALDLGLSPPSATFPALRVATRAVPPFDSAQMYYRLAWRNPAELAEYAHSQWAAPPSELLRKQVLRSAGEGVGKCLLELEVQEFTQVFTSKETSEARIDARRAHQRQLRLASRGVAIVEPGAGSEASSGARAMARAADRALGELAAWVASPHAASWVFGSRPPQERQKISGRKSIAPRCRK